MNNSIVLVLTIGCTLLAKVTVADNPILPGLGLCDPQVRVFDGRVYLYATHDYAPDNKKFRMDEWWAWASDDLVNWKQVSTLKPEQTYLGRPYQSCWAGDAATHRGQYYWYFSAGPRNIGVVSGPTPQGPWSDPLGKALVPEGLTPTAQRDPGILMDDDGANYLVFGTFDFYIARLGDDMISLAETPRLIELDAKGGPFGAGKTDDKPFLHKYNGKYYLSWGCYYAMSDNPYGPYIYQGSIIAPEKTAPKFLVNGLTRDRHGSFFEFKGQWYFICNDFSRPGATNRYRDSIIAYLHYRDNGEIAPIEINQVGVGSYDVSGPVEAENYFEIEGAAKRENASGGFEVRGLTDQSLLVYPNIALVPKEARLTLHLSNGGVAEGKVEVRQNNRAGKVLGEIALPATGGWGKYTDVAVALDDLPSNLSLALCFRGAKGELARLDWWQLKAR